MTDKLMDSDYVKSKAAPIVIIICASFMMLIQTIASGLAVIGYDDVIRAQAKAKEAQILQQSKQSIDIIKRLKELEDRQKQLIIDNDRLKLLSHKPSN